MEECALSCNRHFSSGGHRPATERRRERMENKIRHTSTVNKTKQKKVLGASRRYSSELIPSFPAQLESLCLRGYQTIIAHKSTSTLASTVNIEPENF